MNIHTIRESWTRAHTGNLLVLAALAALAAALVPLQAGHWWIAPPRGSDWLGAGLLLTAYAGLCGGLVLRVRAQARQYESEDTDALLVAWASQTGLARELAERTVQSLREAGVAARLCDLAQLDPASLARCPRALFIVSTTGEGDPPDHAAAFASRSMATPASLAGLRYAVLALGDSDYEHYCGFGHALERWLRDSGASPLFDLIETDNGDPGALRLWQHHLSLSMDAPDLPDWSPPRYDSWTLRERRRLNPGSVGGAVFHIALEPPAGSLPQWQAGDIAEVGPCNPPHAVEAFLATAGLAGDVPVEHDGRTVTLRSLLAGSRLPSPDDAHGLTPQSLVSRLEPLPHREYSIASLPHDGRLELLLRCMLRPDGSPGLGSGWLCEYAQPGDGIALRIRSNPGFHPPDPACPLILIGNGTGIAGLRAHLGARIRAGARRNWLLFGERNAAVDFHYRDQIERWHAEGAIERLDTVFSRDGGPHRYVQDALRASADVLRSWVENGATIYVCGSLQGMAPGVDAVLREALGSDNVDAMLAQGRYRRDVY